MANLSPEKTLEKAMVNATHNWVNQIPVASGLLKDYDQGHTCIDLGHCVSPGHTRLGYLIFVYTLDARNGLKKIRTVLSGQAVDLPN